MAKRTQRRPARSVRLWCDELEPRETPTAAPVIDYATGFTAPGMAGGWLNGFAQGQLLLTENVPYQGVAAFARPRVDVRAFHTSFVFRLDGDPGRLGDGFTFALTSNYPRTYGPAGEGLGYRGLTDSVAVKFDLVDNTGEGTDSVGLFTGGAAPTTPAENLSGTGIDLHNGHPYRADLAYDGLALTVTLTDTTAPDQAWTRAFAVDVPGALRSSTGYVGFTAGTGELTARQAILSWTYAEDTRAPEVNRAPTITTAARALPDTPTTVVLGGGASDDGGADNLTYAWVVVSTPAGASPQVTPITSPDYPAAARVTLDKAGAYNFLLTARDAQGQVATSSVGYLVAPKVTGLEVGPPAATVRAGETARFTAVPLDQFGDRMTLPGPVAWQVLTGPGTIDSAGVYTAPADATGPAVVQAVVPTSPPLVTGQAAVTVIPATPLGGGGVDFGAGFDGANLVRNGSAQLNGPRLELANGAYQAGSAYAPEPVDVRGFTTSFRFQVEDAPFGRYGDGLTFVLQNAGPAGVGVAGGGLGYEGIGRSVAIKFDLVDNAGEGTDSVGVFTNGAAPTVPADTFVHRYPFDLGIQLNSGDRFQATLKYSGGTLLLDLLDLDTYARQFAKAYAVDIPALVGGPTAYIGFTAGTGELSAPIDVLDWTYTPTVDAAGDAAPVLVQGPQAAEYYVRGPSVQLSALAADDGGEANLTYTWRVTSAPPGAGPVRFSANGTNAARTTTATFDAIGRYAFQLRVADAHGNVARTGSGYLSADLSLEVAQTPSAFVVTPATPTVANGEAVRIAVETQDQFGDPMPFGTGSWGLTVEGPGHIDPFSYQYLAPSAGTGTATIRASNGTATGTATITVVDRPPAAEVQFSPGFNQSPNVATNGSAVQAYPWVRLTADTPDQAGSVFTTSPLDASAFATRFQFRLGGPDPRPNPGAGLAFVVQGVGPTAVGSAGAGLGYEGIDRSAAVTIDVAANAIGLATNGSAPAQTVPLAGTGIDLHTGHEFQADLFYDGRTLHVSLTDIATGAAAEATFATDLPALVGGTTAYAGLTGSTGPAVDRFASQQLWGWRYRAVTPGSPNQPPRIVRPLRVVAPVTYGPVTLPLSAELWVRAEDDGGPFDLRYRRELVSAPPGAEVQFDPFEASTFQYDTPGRTSVRFSQPGTYVFRVTVTDAQGLSAASEATFAVGPA